MDESEDPLFLATASGENVKLWSLPNLEDLGLHSIRPYSGVVNCACWSANNSLLATAFDEQINVTGLKGESAVDLFTEAEQLCLCFSSNSRYLLSGSKEGVVHIWDLKHKTKRKSFKDHKSSILCATFNFNDTVIASGGLNGDVLLHSVVSGSVTGPLRTRQTQAVRGIQYSIFKRSLLGTASDDGAVNLWDVNTRQIIKEYKNEHHLPATGLCFSPANDMLVCSVGIDKKIVFYDVVGKKTVKSINTDAPLTSVDFLHNGACLAVGSATGKLQLFDLRAGSTPLKTATADKTAIKTVAFQKPAAKNSSSKGLTRKGSDSSITSTSSNKSKEGKNDPKDTSPSSVVTDYSKEPLKGKTSVEKASPKQPDTLFSPLRGGESDADVATSDVDIVPMETMRAEILKRTAAHASNIPEGQKSDATLPISRNSDAIQLRFSERNKNYDSSIETLNNDLTNLKTRLSKTAISSLVENDQHLKDTVESKRIVNGKAQAQSEVSPPRENAATNEPSSNGLHPFQIDFIRNMIEDAIEDSREAMHRGFIHLQAEMIKQFHIHQEETRKTMEQLSPNQELIKENERLKDEIRRLKTNY